MEVCTSEGADRSRCRTAFLTWLTSLLYDQSITLGLRFANSFVQVSYDNEDLIVLEDQMQECGLTWLELLGDMDTLESFWRALPMDAFLSTWLPFYRIQCELENGRALL